MFSKRFYIIVCIATLIGFSVAIEAIRRQRLLLDEQYSTIVSQVEYIDGQLKYITELHAIIEEYDALAFTLKEKNQALEGMLALQKLMQKRRPPVPQPDPNKRYKDTEKGEYKA